MASVMSLSQAGACSRLATPQATNRSMGAQSSSFAGRVDGLQARGVEMDRRQRGTCIRAGKSPQDDVPGGRFIPATHKHLYEGIEKKGADVANVTYYPKAVDTLKTAKKWYVVDATDKVLGRLASAVAQKIRGKDSAIFTPSMDVGAYVIITNADKVVVSGKKNSQKLYRRHSGRPGGMKVETFDQLQDRIPERIVEKAVKGMLPKGILGRELFRNLKVYKGSKHPHEAQQPQELVINDHMITRA